MDIEFVDRASVPTKPGKLRLLLFPQFEELVKVPDKALRIDIQSIGSSKANLYYVLRQWNNEKLVKLHYVLENARTHPIAYIYAETEKEGENNK